MAYKKIKTNFEVKYLNVLGNTFIKTNNVNKHYKKRRKK